MTRPAVAASPAARRRPRSRGLRRAWAGGAAVRRCQVHALQNPDGDRPAARRSPFSCPPGAGPDNVRRRMQEAKTDPAYIGAAPVPGPAAAAETGFVTAGGIGIRRVAAPFDPALLAGL